MIFGFYLFVSVVQMRYDLMTNNASRYGDDYDIYRNRRVSLDV